MIANNHTKVNKNNVIKKRCFGFEKFIITKVNLQNYKVLQVFISKLLNFNYYAQSTYTPQ